MALVCCHSYYSRVCLPVVCLHPPSSRSCSPFSQSRRPPAAPAACDCAPLRRLALSYLNEDMLIQLGDYHMDIAMKLKRPVLLNIAAAQLHQVGSTGCRAGGCDMRVNQQSKPR